MRLLPVFIVCLTVSQLALAQPPGGGDRGSRGGGGFGAGGGGSGFGGGGGGFEGGGFPGGGMRSGGGDRGGGGGFNPADMLSRFDRNGNKMIDPEEAEGPARFFLERLAQSNPKIDLKRPVPLELLTKEMEKMRGGSPTEVAPSGPAKPELLVPDFSIDSEPPMVEGFGSTSTKFNVKVEERDLKEAEERIRRYDRNNDGVLNKEEIEGNRWSDDPMQFDRNGDGKISKSEMAVRYAKRRADEQAAQSKSQTGGDRGRGGFMFGGGAAPGATGAAGGWSKSETANSRKEKAEEKDRFGDAKSYRMKTAKEKIDGTKGLPDWFARSDADGDGQVLVSEYSSSLTAETLAEFQKFDLNDDFIVTVKECLAAVKNGAKSTSSSASASSSSAAAVPSAASVSSGSVDLDWAKRQIDKYDKNKDGRLTVDEWSSMITKPDGADLNGDGAITAEEYAEFRTKKSQGK
jgi:Ca2+-binding EF-hand superfamily protein